MNIVTNESGEKYITANMFENSMGAIARSFAQVEERFVEVDNRFAKIDQRFNEIDQRFNEIDQKFIEIDKRFTGIEERLDKQDTILELVLKEIRALRSESRDDRLTVAALAHNDIKLETRVTKLEQKLT